MMTFDKLQELIDLLDETPSVTEISIGAPGGEQITIKKPTRFSSANGSGSGSVSGVVGHSAAHIGDTTASDAGEPDPHLADLASAGESADALASYKAIEANRVGVFHTAKPRIEMGERVSSGQIVGFIESIKLMNEVRSSVDGILVAQLLDDGTPVEYGQQLYSIQTADS